MLCPCLSKLSTRYPHFIHRLCQIMGTWQSRSLFVANEQIFLGDPKPFLTWHKVPEIREKWHKVVKMLQKRSFVRIWPDRTVAKVYNVHKIQSNISGNNVVLNYIVKKITKSTIVANFTKSKSPRSPLIGHKAWFPRAPSYVCLPIKKGLALKRARPLHGTTIGQQ